MLPEHRSLLSWSRSLGAQVHATPWQFRPWPLLPPSQVPSWLELFCQKWPWLVATLFLTLHIPDGHGVRLALTCAAWIPGPHLHHDTSTTSDWWLMARCGSADPQSTLALACGNLTHCPVSGELGSSETPYGVGQQLQKVLERPPPSRAHVKDEAPEQRSGSLY